MITLALAVATFASGPDPLKLDLPPSAVGDVSPAEARSTEPIELTSPETRIGLNITDRFGSLTRRIRLLFEPSLNPKHQAAIRERVLRSGLFELDADAPHVATLRRLDRKRVELQTDGPNLATDRTVFDWLEQDPQPQPATVSPNESQNAYEQDRIEVRVRQPDAPPNIGLGPPPGYDPTINPAFGGANFSENSGFNRPSLPSGDDWFMLRNGREIDDRDLALLLDDAALLERIDTERRDSRRRWRYWLGSASGLSAAAGTAMLVVADGDTERRVLAGSFFAISGLALVAALFFDGSSGDHVLSQGQAKDLVMVYNDRLRRDLKGDPR